MGAIVAVLRSCPQRFAGGCIIRNDFGEILFALCLGTRAAPYPLALCSRSGNGAKGTSFTGSEEAMPHLPLQFSLTKRIIQDGVSYAAMGTGKGFCVSLPSDS